MQPVVAEYLKSYKSLFVKEIIKLITSSNLQVDQLSGHTGAVLSVAFSPDGTKLASGSYDMTIRLWDVAKRQQIAELLGSKHFVKDVVFSSDGTKLISGSDDVRLWDVATRQQIAKLSSERISPNLGVLSPDGTKFASFNCRDSGISLWDVARRQEIGQFYGDTEDAMLFTSMAFSQDGTKLVSASGRNNPVIRLWDVPTRQQIGQFSGHKYSVNSVVFSPDGTKVASGSSDNTIRLWDVATQQQVGQFSGPVIDHEDSLVWSITVRVRIPEEEELNSVYSVAFSPDGSMLAAGSDDKIVRLWDIKTGQQIGQLLGHTNHVVSVKFSPNGTLLASGSDDKTIRLWDIRPFIELPQFLKTLYANTTGLKKFLLLKAILESNADKDARGKPKQPKPLELYQPEAIALLKDLPIWLQKPLQDKGMVKVFKKVGQKE